MASRKEGAKKVCGVKGCSDESVRTISAKKVSDSGLKVERSSGKVHLCKEHYKDYKKRTRKDRELERLGW